MDLITTTTTTHLKKLKLQLNCDYFAARNRLLSTTIGSANGQSTAHRLQFETTWPGFMITFQTHKKSEDARIANL